MSTSCPTRDIAFSVPVCATRPHNPSTVFLESCFCCVVLVHVVYSQFVYYHTRDPHLC